MGGIEGVAALPGEGVCGMLVFWQWQGRCWLVLACGGAAGWEKLIDACVRVCVFMCVRGFAGGVGDGLMVAWAAGIGRSLRAKRWVV